MIEDLYKRKSDLFWEIFGESITIGHNDPVSGIPCQINSIEIARDNNYKLRGTIDGTQSSQNKSSPTRNIPGSRVELTNIAGIDSKTGLEYEISGCYHICSKSTCNPQELQTSWPYRCTVGIGNVKIRYDKDLELTNLTEWYLNGPTDPFMFFRPTHYSLDP